jgi:hypothetical protein
LKLSEPYNDAKNGDCKSKTLGTDFQLAREKPRFILLCLVGT